MEVYHLQKVKDIIEGGEERYLSVYNALKAAGACDYIYIHDGARPFVDQEMLQRLKRSGMHLWCVCGSSSFERYTETG